MYKIQLKRIQIHNKQIYIHIKRDELHFAVGRTARVYACSHAPNERNLGAHSSVRATLEVRQLVGSHKSASHC